MSNLRIKSYFVLNKQNKFVFTLLKAGIRRGKAGFTLVELIVTMTVLLIITTISLAKYPEFNQRVALKKTVQEVALVVRQAQAYGLGVKEYVPGSGIYPGYGVNFDLSEPAKFRLFADLNDNRVYDSESGELIELFEIKDGSKIVRLCQNSGANCSMSILDVVYYRPSPVVYITADGIINLSNADVIFKSPNGRAKTIKIWQSGQISVQ